MASKAEAIYKQVEALVSGGSERSSAFKEVADSLKLSVDGVRGSYYAHRRKLSGGTVSRTKHRETTTETALADARAALERSIENIDKELEQAATRAAETKAEYDALGASAAERKAAITERLETLR